MQILITGGAGFIGSNLAIHLRKVLPETEVVCMDNLYRRGSELNVPRLHAAGARFIHGDIRELGDFPAGRFDILIECSAEPSVLAGQESSPNYLFYTNVTGAFHCLEAARRMGSRVIFLSTSRVYPVATLENHPWEEHDTRYVWLDNGTLGISPQGVSETLPLAGARSLYGFTKLAAEHLIEEYRETYGLKAVVNRCGVVAGPWQFGKVDQGVIALWVMAHVFHRKLAYIGYGGAGKQVRDVLHVADLCELITDQVVSFDQWEGWVGNVAGGLANSVSLAELTALCRDVTGETIGIDSIPDTRFADLRLFVADCSRLFARTSWRPRRDMRRLVEDTYSWIQEHRSQLQSLS